MKIGIKNVLIMGLILILSVGIGGTTFTRLKATSGSDDGARITIYIDQIETDVVEAPFLMNDRTMIPLRGLFESLGATVDYNEITKQAIIKTDEREILLEIGNQFVLVNGQLESLDAASQLKNNRTYIPLRFVAEALGYQVDWDAQNRRVLINTKNPEVLKQEDLPLVGDKEHLKQLIGYSQNLSSYMNQSWRVTGDMVFEVTTEKAEESTTSSEEIADLAPEATNEESSQSAGDGDGSDNTSTEHSETNNQTEGVEEGDIIKTDGKYIYHLNQNQVNIFSVDPNQPSLVSTLRLEDQNRQITDIYLEGNTLVLIGSSYNYSYYPTETYETTETLKPEEVAVEDVVFPAIEIFSICALSFSTISYIIFTIFASSFTVITGITCLNIYPLSEYLF